MYQMIAEKLGGAKTMKLFRPWEMAAQFPIAHEALQMAGDFEKLVLTFGDVTITFKKMVI